MRTDSIYAKLERHDRKAGTTYLSDLMIFLGEAEGDRFGKAAELVSDTWKIPTSKTALCEGYNSFLPFWRLERAAAAAKSTETSATFEPQQSRLIAQRTFELLTSPDLDPKILLGFAKVEIDRVKAANDSRRVKLLEDKMTEARDLVSAAQKKGNGGLTKETLKAIEEKLAL